MKRLSSMLATCTALLLVFGTAIGQESPSKNPWPFDPDRASLYSRDDLLTGYDSDPANNNSLDWKIFEYYLGASKYSPARPELAAQRHHDSGMDSAVNAYLNIDETSAPKEKRVVVVMGSHSMYRDDPWYRKAAEMGYSLKKAGYTVVSGGGPGIMEATHLGAWMSKYGTADLDKAIALLATTSKPEPGSSKKQYEMGDYWLKAVEVTKMYPNGNESLGIPTWFYGHEGANAFATHVAKYFSNALREEKLCAIGVHGIVFFPGGPGTAQEIFMDAAENGYASYNWYSPMVFYSDRPETEKARELVTAYMKGKKYGDLSMIHAASTAKDVVGFLDSHPPVHKQAAVPQAIPTRAPKVEASPVD